MNLLTGLLLLAFPVYCWANNYICSCGVFDDKNLREDEKISGNPVLKKQVFSVPCNNGGEETCKEECLKMARVADKTADVMLCVALGATEPTGFKAALYHQTCDNHWKYSGVTAPFPFCCFLGFPVPCKKQ